jgi:hypothetical protein
VKGAQELGAVGVLIYSDPRDDGTVTSENGYTVYVPYSSIISHIPTYLYKGILMGRLATQHLYSEALCNSFLPTPAILPPLAFRHTKTRQE